MNPEKSVLNRNYEFQRVYRSGKSMVSPILVTYVRKRKGGKIITGISASKKIGCAVERNRARRLIKAAAREILPEVDGSFDIVFVCRGATVRSSSTAVAAVMRQHLKKLGVL